MVVGVTKAPIQGLVVVGALGAAAVAEAKSLFVRYFKRGLFCADAARG